MYIFLSSEDYNNYFTDVKPYSFSTRLAKRLDLEGEWECCLKELLIRRKSSLEGYFLLTTNLVHPSNAHGRDLPVLRTFDLQADNQTRRTLDKFVYDSGYYFPLRSNQHYMVEISIQDRDLKYPVGIEGVTCVLHLRRVS